VLDVDKTDGAGNVTGDILVRQWRAGAPVALLMTPNGPFLVLRQGALECRLSDVVAARGCTLVGPLKSKRSQKARAPPVSVCRCVR
jgi:hypothetical protein